LPAIGLGQSFETGARKRDDARRTRGDIDVFSIVTPQDRDDLRFEAPVAPLGVHSDEFSEPSWKSNRPRDRCFVASDSVGGGHNRFCTILVQTGHRGGGRESPHDSLSWLARSDPARVDTLATRRPSQVDEGLESAEEHPFAVERQ
jgi:hypothetical protein